MVDPVSGSRTAIADVGAPLFASWIKDIDGIVVTPNVIGDHYFLGIEDWQTTPSISVISTNNDNPGPEVKKMVQGAALDEANNRLFVLDGDDQLIAVDLDSGNRVLLMGEVSGFGSFSFQEKDLEYDALKKLLYIADSNFYTGLYVVDPQSGSVVLLSN